MTKAQPEWESPKGGPVTATEPGGEPTALALSAAAAAQFAEVLAADPASDEALTPGLVTMIRDEPGYRISLSVEEFGSDSALEMVLQTDPQISWWKSCSYFMAAQGGRGTGPEIRIEVKDRVHEARQLLYLPDLTRYGVFELWKGGFAGFGAFAGSLPINSYANRNRRVIFRWLQD